jgi:hypothetical protein
MASMHFNHRRPKQSFLSNIGNKVKQAAEIAGAVKGIYDVGRMIYQGVQTLGPAVASAGILL